MINSRDLNELNPEVQKRARDFLAKAKAAGFDVLVTSTFRDAASQNSIYAQGRTKPGTKVTNAKAGQSWHNFRCAFDIVPLISVGDKKVADWNDMKKFHALGKIGRECGLEWGGDWTSFKDYPHFQYTGGLTLSQLRAKYGVEAPKTW